MNTNTPASSSTMTRVIVVVAIILIGGALAYSILGKKGVAPAASTLIASTTNSVTTVTTSSTYKNGTYSAVGSYLSPGGDEKIAVQVTLKDDIVTVASVTPMPVSGEGKKYQELFAANFQSQVVGKDISSIHLTQVSGSSLTPQGFDDALTQIEASAKV